MASTLSIQHQDFEQFTELLTTAIEIDPDEYAGTELANVVVV